MLVVTAPSGRFKARRTWPLAGPLPVAGDIRLPGVDCEWVLT